MRDKLPTPRRFGIAPQQFARRAEPRLSGKNLLFDAERSAPISLPEIIP
jgi:hypothetical protein